MSENPPTQLPRLPRYDPWAIIADTLRETPGVWHSIRADQTTATTNINDGVLAAFRPAGDFEARRTAGRLEVRAIDDRFTPDPMTSSDLLAIDTVECVVCFGSGLSDATRPCMICNGTGFIR